VIIGAVTIGQSPRDDVLPDVASRLHATDRIVQRGALDGLAPAELASLAPRQGGDVLVTQLRDGTEIVVSADLIVPLLQQALDRVVAQGAQLVAVLCSGSFEGLHSCVPVLFPGDMLRKLTAGMAEGRRLGIIVPAAGQADEARRHWEGRARAVRVLAASPYGDPGEVSRAAAVLAGWRAEVVVLDCIGFSRATQALVQGIVRAPVIVPRTVLAGALAARLPRTGRRAGADGLDDVAGGAGWVERPHRPGRACAGELVHVAAGRGGEHDVETVQRSALAGHHFEHRAEPFRRSVVGEQPVEAGRPPERARLTGTAGRAPQGRPRLLERPRQEGDSSGPVVLALMMDFLAGPQSKHQVQGFIHPFGQDAFVRLFSEPAHFAIGVDAEADAQGQAAIGEVIQADGRAGKSVWPPAGQRGDGGPDTHAARSRRDGGQCRPGVPGVTVVTGPAQHVVPQEEPVPASLLRGDGQLNEHAGVGEIVKGGHMDGVAHALRLPGSRLAGTVQARFARPATRWSRDNGAMLIDHWPLLGLRLITPRLELRLPSGEELSDLADLAAEGMHDPGSRPFLVSWPGLPPKERARALVQRHWRHLGDWSASDWSLDLAVFADGQVVGQQQISARDYPVLREVSTFSWLGLRHHGKGIGSQMRIAALHLAFTGLGATDAVSGAFDDNAASLRVSEKLGYQPDGIERLPAHGRVTTTRRLRLTRERWEAGGREPVTIAGLAPCLPLFGLPGADHDPAPA
jgi:RimJ/RimL family protein N-acetyltransferase